MSRVRVVDMGADRIRKRLAELDARSVTVGFQGERGDDTHPSGGTRVTDVAALIHAGTEDMPARPYFDLAIAALPSEVDLAAAARHAVKARAGVAAGLAELGEDMVETVREAITRTGAVDTGTVRDAVSFEIEVDR